MVGLRRRAMMIQQKSQLPQGYQAVEYIESDGGQYIETDLKITALKFSYEVEAMANASKEMVIIGSYPFSGGSGLAHAIEYSSSGQNLVCFGGNTSAIARPGVSYVGIKYRIKAEYSDVSPTKKITASDGVNEWTESQNSANRVASAKTCVFSDASRTNYRLQGRIYWAKITEDDVLKIHLIPCYRKSDDVIGMYDIVNDYFYTNKGTGTFTKGANV